MEWIPYTTLEFTVIFTLLLLGIFANCLVIVTILSQRRLQTNYYILVLHLAICDLFLAIANLLITALAHWRYDKTPLYCYKIIYIPVDTFYSGDFFIIVLIAILRYKAIAYPLVKSLTKERLVCLIGSVYILSFLTALISAFISFGLISSKSFELVFDLTVYIAGYFVGVVCLLLLYGRACLLLRAHDRLVANSDPDKKDSNILRVDVRQKRSKKIVRTCFIVVLFFVVSTLANQLRAIDTIFNNSIEWLSNPRFHHWSFIVYIFGIVTINPFVYAFSDRVLFASFKKRLVLLMDNLCSFGKRKSSNPEVLV